MSKYEQVVNGLECCACNKTENENCLICPYTDSPNSCIDDLEKDTLEVLKEQQGISVDEFLKWCIESHRMGDATRNGIEYWINEFKAWKQKAKDGKQE